MNMTTMSTAPTWTSVLTSWTLTPIPDLLIAAATLTYLLILRRHRRRNTASWPPLRVASGMLAMAALVVALNSSMARYGDNLFWVHMLVHLMLIMVVPVLVVWAQPIRLARDASGPRARAVIDTVITSRPARVLTSPAFTIPLYTAVLVLTHLTGFQQAMGTHMWIHNTELVLYLVTGYLLFLALVGNELVPRRLPYPLRFLALGLCMGPDTLVGVGLMLTGTPLAPAYAASHPGWGPSALADQGIAGAIMWVGGDGLMMILMLITARAWTRAGQTDRGLGTWLDGIRRQATVGDAGTAGTDIDADDDAGALEAYNAKLAALHGSSRHPGQARQR